MSATVQKVKMMNLVAKTGTTTAKFYEQLQYSMDTRSSAIFTYLVSGDDHLTHQAIIQLHDSFNPSIGLLTGRSIYGSVQRQYIVSFTLHWACTMVDHYEYCADAALVRKFLGVADSVIETFTSRFSF